MADIVEQAKELRSMWSGFWSSRVLLTANNYRLFDHLKSPKTADEAARILRTDKRATARLLDALTGLGLLKKTASIYRNASISNRFLVSESPYYQGDIIRHNETLWRNWSGLDGVVKTGKPNHAAHDQYSFIMGMHNLAVLKAGKVVKEIGLRGVKKALDLGGGPGTYSIEMAKKGVSVTLFDRPETIAIAKEVVKKADVKNIDFLRGDFLYDDIGKGYDLVFISHVLHSCSESDGFRAVKKSKEALNPKGRVVVQEFYINEDLASPAPSALFAINMLVNTPGGRCYSPPEIKEWLARAGLKRMTDKMLDETVLIFAEKS